jgi:hypothetical protein
LRCFAFVSTRGSLYQFAGAVNRLFEMAESSRVRFDQRLSAPAHLAQAFADSRGGCVQLICSLYTGPIIEPSLL